MKGALSQLMFLLMKDSHRLGCYKQCYLLLSGGFEDESEDGSVFFFVQHIIVYEKICD